MSAPRVALVTGASRGIGLAVAEALRDEGWRVHACAHAAPALADVSGYACDVADAAAVKAMVAAVVAAERGLDLVVNNAGVAGANTLDPDAPDDAWRHIIGVNLTGTYLVSKATAPHLRDHGGRIVNVSSALGLKGAADQTAYCAAKHGVIGFTRALALALAPRGITVNALCPGWVDTAMARARFDALAMTPQAAAEATPLGRIASPADIAAAVLFLASPAARHITGAALPIDGGALA